MNAENHLSDAWIRELLKPLQNEEIEYQHQYKMLSEFQRRLQSVESLYSEVYSKMTLLEQQLRCQKP